MNICLTENALKRKDFAELWNAAHRYRLGGVSLSLSEKGSFSEEDIGRIQVEVRRTGIPLVSLRVPLQSTIFSSLGYILPQAIRTCSRIGSSNLVLQVGGFFQENSEELIDLFQPALNAAISEAQEKGVNLLLEGPISSSLMQRIMGGKSIPFVGVSFDPAAAYWFGMDPIQEMQHLGIQVKQLVCKDIDATPGDCRIGRGYVEYSGIKALLAKGLSNSMDWLVLDGPPSLPELVGRDCSYLRYVFHSFLEKNLKWPVFGAMSYEFPYTIGQLEPFIENLKQKKIEYIQVGGALLTEILEHPERVADIKKALEEEGIYFVGIAAYKNLVARDQEKRLQNLELMKRYLQLAPLLGVSPVATETGTFNPDHDFRHSPRNYSMEAWKELYKSLDVLVPIAEENHSCLALEGYVNNIVGTLPQLAQVLRDYPTDAIQLVSDPCNFLHSRLLPVQEKVTQAFLEGFEERLIIAHIKDVKPTGAETGTPGFGEGVFNISSYLQFLYQRRPDLPLVLEHQTSEEVPAVMERVMSKVKEMIQQFEEE